MKKQNLLAKQIKHGEEHNVFLENGSVMEIQIVSMALMKTQLYIIALPLNLAPKINSLVRTEDALTK